MLKLHHEYHGAVSNVADGDGLEVFGDFVSFRIRLRHIDAPESGQPFAAQSKQYLKQLCLGKAIVFRIHKWDNYSRGIGDVDLLNGRNLSAAMLEHGLAWWYRRHSRSPYYGGIEKLARENRKGLWKDPNPTPPWEFRKAKKLRSRKRC